MLYPMFKFRFAHHQVHYILDNNPENKTIFPGIGACNRSIAQSKGWEVSN